jgi:hypothetical protein
MAGNKYSMASMMLPSQATAPVPTQTFNAANILGTPVPQVGDNKGNPNYAAGTGSNKVQVVLVAVAIIAVGYVVYHVNFEK